MTTDLLGTPLTASEAALLDVYDAAKRLATDEALAPTTRSNVLVATAALGVAVTGLGLRFEHLTDLGA